MMMMMVVVMWTSMKLGKVLQYIKFSAIYGIGYYKLKQHKPWFDKWYSKLLDQRKQARL